MDDYREQLVTLAEKFSQARKLSEARTANLAGCDSRFFMRMRDPKKTCSVDTFNRLLQWFSDNWPADTAWPEGVTRPERQPTERSAA